MHHTLARFSTDRLSSDTAPKSSATSPPCRVGALAGGASIRDQPLRSQAFLSRGNERRRHTEQHIILNRAIRPTMMADIWVQSVASRTGRHAKDKAVPLAGAPRNPSFATGVGVGSCQARRPRRVWACRQTSGIDEGTVPLCVKLSRFGRSYDRMQI